MKSTSKKPAEGEGSQAKLSAAPLHVIDEIEIRDRYWILVQKIKSLKVAIDERRNQLVTLRQYDESSRPLRSARVRPPKYITALQNMVDRDIRTLKEEYANGKSKKAYTSKVMVKIDNLVEELESSLDNVLQSMYVPATKVLKVDIDKEDAAKVTFDESVKVIESNTDHTTQEDEAKDDDTISEVRSDQHSRTSSLLPDIKPVKANSPDAESLNSLETVNLVTPRKDAQTASAPPSLLSRVQTRPGGLTRGYTTLTRPTYKPKGHFEMNKHRKPMVGYPFGSAFPSLPPLPSKEQREAALYSSLGFGAPITQSRNSGQVSSKGLPPKPVRRMNTFFVKRTLREKTWF